MIKEYQVTLFCTTKQYKPVSCIVKAEALDITKVENKKDIMMQGIKKICCQHKWTLAHLKRDHYTEAKVREYDKEKLAAEAIARYELIKEEKYKTGEWKRPKAKN